MADGLLRSRLNAGASGESSRLSTSQNWSQPVTARPRQGMNSRGVAHASLMQPLPSATWLTRNR
eukprot:3211380-Pyramimonas_sp.AAC.1